jgi:hypothetical protein
MRRIVIFGAFGFTVFTGLYKNGVILEGKLWDRNFVFFCKVLFENFLILRRTERDMIKM